MLSLLHLMRLPQALSQPQGNQGNQSYDPPFPDVDEAQIPVKSPRGFVYCIPALALPFTGWAILSSLHLMTSFLLISVLHHLVAVG